MRSFVKSKPLQNSKITLSFTDIVMSCPSREFLMSQICLFMLFAKISKFTVPLLSAEFVKRNVHVDDQWSNPF